MNNTAKEIDELVERLQMGRPYSISEALGFRKNKFSILSKALDDAYSAGKADGFAEAVKQKEVADAHLSRCVICGDKPYRLFIVCRKHLTQDASFGLNEKNSLEPTSDKPQQEEKTV